MVGQEGGVLALSGEEEGKDAHNRCHASDIVWGLSFCNGCEVKIVHQKVLLVIQNSPHLFHPVSSPEHLLEP